MPKLRRLVAQAEPAMDFDVEVFPDWIIDIHPEYVWLGLNSKPASVQLPEPSPEKLRQLVTRLRDAGIRVKGKDLRGLDLGL